MNRYQPSAFRPAFAIASVAMTALTIGLMVVVPAELNLADPESPAVMARADDSAASATDASGRGRADPMGACESGPEIDATLSVRQERV